MSDNTPLTGSSLGVDGTVDNLWRRVSKKPVAAIFIHAGAGYHSPANERIHLEACHKAARIGMTLLKAGASATQAVEAAIRSLEDNEITNAGFGSNLNIEGIVECDATVVDHLGRSGACAAVAGVKNPISLAKKILDTSTQPLSLRRVPPNLLVGSGATQFAKENGIETVLNPSLVSKNAEDRYLRWREDLKRAEARERARKAKAAAVSSSIRRTPSPTPYDKAAHPSNAPEMRDHSTAIFTGTWNEGQPDSPDRSGSPSGGHDPSRTTDSAMSYDEGEASSFEGGDDTDPGGPMKRRRIDTEEEPPATDMITDTVGAIAIDLQGHIAAGSSSGGIGMKHRGRAGPAALVGVGTAVVPTDPSDEEGISTAAVTSGTGEHMATTMASAKCAERLYHGTRRGPGGRDVPEPDEHAVLDSFVVNDFMNHPGVRGQPSSAAAIGVMAVKKDRHAAYFYFAHNTDSFALASMASTEREPLCVMSRLGKQGGVAQGGRRVKLG